ncbi:mitochondrial Type II secretion system (T2SS) F-like protein (GspF) [Andalucia godoyi]|uniref:Mitochondrial Type II secretion system (T2SS) F-like protein (GspF) n=1 Tax=Andalucia godoyi TaxID=505711 RepID=A0A8K0F4M0_ANDGO|nr:mitochondrial Type II secretion system (T2SS) F-like protein (GspF) [Andalucia godoyi]|eukprot:ANDGO_01917.mRNA.1 mitochondrial Type II secretion system (T2SS) F-like protein (GspF)
MTIHSMASRGSVHLRRVYRLVRHLNVPSVGQAPSMTGASSSIDHDQIADSRSSSSFLWKIVRSVHGKGALSDESLQAFNNILFLVNSAPATANTVSIFDVMMRSSSATSDLLPFLSQLKIPRSALGGADYATFITMLAKVKVFLPAWYYSCLVLGRAIGDFDKVLSFAAQRFAQDIRLRNELYSSLAYPALMMFLAIAAIVVLVTTILPRNIQQFEALNLAVPPFLRLIHTLIHRVDYYWLALLYLVPQALSSHYLPFRTWLKLHYLRLHTPLSHLALLRDKATVLHMLSLLDKDHVSSKLILSCVNLTGNVVLQQMLESMAAKARSGGTPEEVFGYLLTQKHVFSPYEIAYLQACFVSRKHSVVQEGLRYVSQAVTRQYVARVKAMLGIIQPATTVLVGLLVVFIAAVGILPLIQLTDAVSLQ